MVTREILATVLAGGGPGWEAALEPFLTEIANDRVVGALTTMRLAHVAAWALWEIASAGAEEPDDPDRIVEQALDIVNGLLAMLVAEDSG